MSLNTKAAAFLATDAARAALTRLYGHDAAVLAHQTERYNALAQRHIELFGEKDGMRFVSAPGRTEVAGNHTDHNHGRCLAGAVNLDTIACVEKTDDGVIVVDSEGFPPILSLIHI